MASCPFTIMHPCKGDAPIKAMEEMSFQMGVFEIKLTRSAGSSAQLMNNRHNSRLH